MTEVDFHKAARKRIGFIESVCCWEGRVQRQRVCEAMLVSPNHLTRDFRSYRSRFPENITYDVSQRCYRPGRKFKPKVATGSPDEYLRLLRSDAEARVASVATAPSELPGPKDAAVVDTPQGVVERLALQALTRAIARAGGVSATYQSMSSREPVQRSLWPHDLVFSGHRWHVRAYDSKHQRFGDFVLARFTAAELLTDTPTPEAALRDHDADWVEMASLEVEPNPVLSSDQRRAIASEYGMKPVGRRFVWITTMRRCLVPYFIHFHRLDTRRKGERIVLSDMSLLEQYAFPDT